MRWAAALALFWVLPAGAQERPEQFQHAARIAAGAGEDSHYRFTLPAATYRGVTRPDLADLRVFNGAGEPVPYAFVPLRPAKNAPVVRATKLFPLRGEAAKGLDGLNVRIRHTPGGGTSVDVSSSSTAKERKLLGYILDPGEQETPFAALVLDWRSGTGFTGTARVEGSEDLKAWRALANAAPVLRLEHRGQRLERKRVELPGARARYLRISFTGVPGDFQLTQARLELRAGKAEPAREWATLAGKEDPERPGEYEFDTGGHFPVDRLRFALPQVNTVAQVQVLARRTEEPPVRIGRRGRAADPWRYATSATLYRLRRNGAEVVNADLAVGPSASRHWRLKVDQRGGGLGGGEVRLEIGWIPHEVVYAARGAGPFTLAYGMKIAKPGALPITAVLPDYKEGQAIALKTASLAETAAPAPRTDAGFSEHFREAVDSGQAKKWALWAALVAGVLLLVWMAFALLRQVGKPKQ